MLYVAIELPMEKVRLGEFFFQQSEAADDACPTPAVMLCREDFYLEYIAGLGTFDKDGTGQGMNTCAIDGEKFFSSHSRHNLAATGFEAVEVNRVSICDVESRLERAVPNGVSWRR